MVDCPRIEIVVIMTRSFISMFKKEVMLKAPKDFWDFRNLIEVEMARSTWLTKRKL